MIWSTITFIPRLIYNLLYFLIIKPFRCILNVSTQKTLIFFGLMLACFVGGDVYFYLKVQKANGLLPIDDGEKIANISVPHEPCYSTPWCYINFKKLILDHLPVYIYGQLSFYIQTGFNLVEISFITPTQLSILGVLFAAISARLIIHESLEVRRLGVLVYLLRNIVDVLDGQLAIARSSQNKRNSRDDEAKNYGYYIDGYCDGLGFSILLIACLIYVRRHPSYSQLPKYHRLSSQSNSDAQSNSPDLKLQHNSSKLWSYLLPSASSSKPDEKPTGTPGIVAVNFGFQALVSSILWNRCLLRGSQLLENLSNKNKEAGGKIVKSTTFWIFTMVWRFFNPQALQDTLLAAIFIDQMAEFLMFIKFIGFATLGLVGVLSEYYMNYYVPIKLNN